MGSRGRPDATALQDLTPMREGAYLESSYIPPSSSDLVTEQLLAMHQRMFEMDRRHREEVAALNAKHEEALRHILQMKALESQSLNAPLSALPSHAADASAAPAVPPVAIAQQEMMALPRAEAALMAKHEMVVNREDFRRRRTRLSLVVPREELLRSPGLRVATSLLFGPKADAMWQQYFKTLGLTV